MCSDAAIHTSHVTSSSPSTFANPSPAPGSRPSTSAASGAASRPTTSISRKSPSAAAMRPGRVPWSAMSLYEPIASLPLRIEGYALERLARTVSSGFERKSTTFVLAGRRRGGPRRGRHLRGRGARRPAAGRAGARAGRRVDVRLLLRAPLHARPLPRLHPAAGRLSPLPALGLRVGGAGPRAAPGRARRCTSCSAGQRSRSRSSSPRGWAIRRRSRRSRGGWPSTRTSASSSTRRRTGPRS